MPKNVPFIKIEKLLNSKNFKLGIIIKGEKARNIGLIFDRLYSVSFDIELKEEDDGSVVY